MASLRHSWLISIFLAIAVCASSECVGGTYSGGDGSIGNPYLISDANDMQAIGTDPCDWDKHFVMTSDIDLGAYTGTQFNIIENFTGVFDGNNHSISNFSITNYNQNTGVFKVIDDPNAVVKNLCLIDPFIYATNDKVGSLAGLLNNGTVSNCCANNAYVEGRERYVGGLIGYAQSGRIENCSTSGTVIAHDDYSGGLVGLSKVQIIDCVSDCNTTGYEDYVGGLTGFNTSTITGCVATGQVTGFFQSIGGLAGVNGGDITFSSAQGLVTGMDYTGGLVGSNLDSSQITSCSASGNVIVHDSYAGGLVGQNRGTITNSFAVGDVQAGIETGGLVGLNWTGIITYCYATGDVNANGYAGGLIGGHQEAEVYLSYARGQVTGDYRLGGLIGQITINGDSASVYNCYASGNVTGTGEKIGGLVGYSYRSGFEGIIVVGKSASWGRVVGDSEVGGLIGALGWSSGTNASTSYWDIDTSGQTDSAGGIGRNTSQMQTRSTYNLWDFTTVWDICEGMNYPKLRWQAPIAGDFGCPDGVDMVDFSFFASRWLEIYCDSTNNCGGADLDLSTSVGVGDLLILTQNWLEGTQ